MESLKKTKEETRVRILQIDFAMSFSCEYQNEIQSALRSRSSVLLFAAAVFWRYECEDYVICSDTKKGQENFLAFLNFFYSEMIKEIDEVSEEII